MIGNHTIEERISDLVSSMDQHERMIFVSYFYNQMCVEDIAKETGISKDVVVRSLILSSKKVTGAIGEGNIYYAALVSFLALSEEASECKSP